MNSVRVLRWVGYNYYLSNIILLLYFIQIMNCISYYKLLNSCNLQDTQMEASYIKNDNFLLHFFMHSDAYFLMLKQGIYYRNKEFITETRNLLTISWFVHCVRHFIFIHILKVNNCVHYNKAWKIKFSAILMTLDLYIVMVNIGYILKAHRWGKVLLVS
jgi:hypothetical protein